MMFGNVASFAVESELDSAEGKWLFGRFRLWIAGKPVGDFEETCDLAASARWGRQFLRATFRRTRPDLDERRAEDVYVQLYERFLGGGAAQAHELWDRDPFLLDEIGESALRDLVTVLVVRRSDGGDRVLVRDHEEEILQEYFITAGTVDRVLDAYCSWIESRTI